MDGTALGTRMKFYEKQFRQKLSPHLPYVARLDGMNFSKWTKGLNKPFDDRLVDLMRESTKYLVDVCNGEVVMGYTQSDEISLVFREGLNYSNMWWAGRTDKISSFLVSHLTYFFNTNNDFKEKPAFFDCRIMQLPNRQEAINAIVWREQDATKNSIAMLAQSEFSHKSLENLNGSQMQDRLMLEKNINWNDLDRKYKRGSYVQRKKVVRPFTVEEIENLPLKHQARSNPNLEIERTVVDFIDLPIITKVINRQEVFFNGAKPKTL